MDAPSGYQSLLGTGFYPPFSIAGVTPNKPALFDVTGTITSGDVDLKTQTTGTLGVTRGGTGSTVALAGNRLMLSSAVQSIIEGSALTNGQLFIGSTAAAPVAGSLSAGSTSIVVTPGAGSLSINTAQPIAVSDSPTWADITDTELTASTWVCANGAKKLVSQTLAGTANQVILTGAAGSGATTLSLPQSIATTSAVTFADVTDSALTASTWVCADAAKKLVTQTLAGTTDQVILTGAAGSGTTTLSLPQSIATTSSPSFSAINLSTGTLNYGAFAAFVLPSNSSSDTLVGVSIAASLTNKRFEDSSCMFYSKFDATKLLKFNCISQATGTTYSIAPSITVGRKLTLPDATGVALVDTDTTARTIASTWTLSNAPVLSSLTASRPLKLTAGKVVTSSQIDLANANDVTGVLPAGSVQPASATDPGIVTTGAQSFPSGRKTFTDQLECFELYTNGTAYIQQSVNQMQLGLNPGNRIVITAPAPAATRTYTMPDAGANCEFVMASGSQNISGSKGFLLAVPIFATTNQLVLGTTNTTTINSTAPAASRVVTLPDAGANSSFVLSEGNSTVNGIKSFGNTTDSTSVSTGAVVVSGGIGCAKNMTSLTQTTTGTTDASSLTTGAVITAGGIGCSKTIYCNNLNCANRIVQKEYYLILRNTVAQSIANSTFTGVTFTAAAYSANWAPAFGTPSTFTAPVTGKYKCAASATFASNVTGLRFLTLIVNGATRWYTQGQPASVGGNGSYLSVSGHVHLASGDTIGMQVFQDSGGALNVSGSAGVNDSVMSLVYDCA